MFTTTLPPYIQKKQAPTAMSRRHFLFASTLVGSALIIGCSANPTADSKAQVAPPPPPISPFEAYLAIDAQSGQITVFSSQFDMGQHVYHGLATLVAEELEVPVASLRVQGKAGNPAAYGNPMMGGAFQLTGGSSSMPGSWERYRKAGAIARELLKQAASQKLGVPVAELSARDGHIVHSGKNLTIPYAELVSEAAKLPVPTDIALKASTQFSQIGKEDRFTLYAKEKSTGKQPFTIDVQLPEMRVATIVRAPRFGAVVKTVDDRAAKAIAGVEHVVQIPTGVAVVASNTWAAMQGAGALQIEWDDTKSEIRSSKQILDAFAAAPFEDALKSTQKGDTPKAFGKAKSFIEAEYRFPYLAHAALEPLNAIAHKSGEVLHLYGGLQMPDVVQGTCAAIAEVTPENVALHVMPTGGGFGRRAVADCDVFVEATSIAKAIGFAYPVKLQWLRATDMTGGRYRPAHLHRVKVGINAEGEIAGWQHHIVGQSILKNTPFESMLKGGIDEASTEGVHNTPYQLADFDLRVTHPESAISVLWWRSVGHTHTAYVMETMMDELAVASGADPVQFRLKHLAKDARERAVLELAAEKANWGKANAANRFQGIAVHSSFGSFVATVAEVSKASDGSIKVERCVVASDCGLVINPDVVRAQLEGGTGFGLGSILAESLDIELGGAVQQNYDGYRILRMDGMPVIETHLLASTQSPTGIGECAVPPIGPALANAIFKATGQRVRELPYLKANA